MMRRKWFESVGCFTSELCSCGLPAEAASFCFPVKHDRSCWCVHCSLQAMNKVILDGRNGDCDLLKSISSPLIKLNVGGKKYVTTECTLRNRGTNFFTVLLDKIADGRMKCTTDEEGYIFIDRNGGAFEAVLEYLRNGLLLMPCGLSLRQVEKEFDFYSLGKENVQLESVQLATHSKWQTMAELFFTKYWTDIRKQLYEIVEEHGLNCCSLTLVHELCKSPESSVQRYYNNVRVCLDPVCFAAPLKPLFLDNVMYIFKEHGFQSSYVNRQQTVDISLSWSLQNEPLTTQDPEEA